MVSLNTTANYSEQATRIWQDMLSGLLPFEQGRALFIALRQQQGDDAARATQIADSLVAAAKEQRGAGLASGASWAQAPQAQDPYESDIEAKYTPTEQGQARSQRIVNQKQLRDRYLEENPSAAWDRAFNLPTVGGNPFQDWLSGQQPLTYAAFAGQEALGRQTGAAPTAYSSFLGNQGEGLGLAGKAALSSLNTARTLSPVNQNTFLGDVTATDPEGSPGASLRNLFLAALQGKGYAAPLARSFSRNVPGYENQWNTETLGGQQAGSPTMLQYLMKSLGL